MPSFHGADGTVHVAKMDGISGSSGTYEERTILGRDEFNRQDAESAKDCGIVKRGFLAPSTSIHLGVLGV
jgi:hypothetical protein